MKISEEVIHTGHISLLAGISFDMYLNTLAHNLSNSYLILCWLMFVLSLASSLDSQIVSLSDFCCFKMMFFGL